MGLREHYCERSGGNEIPAKLFKILKDDAVKVPANLENSEWPQDWKRPDFIPILKKGRAK